MLAGAKNSWAFSCLVLLMIISATFAADDCPACADFLNNPKAKVLITADENTHIADIVVYYEDSAATPSRQPVSDSIVIVELTNATGLSKLYKTYTDSTGKATFDFTQWSGACVNIKALYCPFCTGGGTECGFAQCLGYSKIKNKSGDYQENWDITSADKIDVWGSAPVPSPFNPNRYFPDLSNVLYCAPPKPNALTPALCLPLIIIFSLLSGAMYMTGRNPFAAFNIGGARIGKHIRYQARGRGFSLNVQSLITAGSSLTKVVKAGKAGELGKRIKEDAKATGGPMKAFGLTKSMQGLSALKATNKEISGLKGDARSIAFASRMDMKMAAGAGGAKGGGAQKLTDRGLVSAGGGSRAKGSDFLALNVGKDKDGKASVTNWATAKMDWKAVGAFVFSQTAIGRMMDSYSSIGTLRPMTDEKGRFLDEKGKVVPTKEQAALRYDDTKPKGIFEAFLDHSGKNAVRAACDIAVVNSMIANGGVKAQLPNGTEVVVTGIKTTMVGDKKVTEYTLAVPEGAKGGTNPDGTVTMGAGKFTVAQDVTGKPVAGFMITNTEDSKVRLTQTTDKEGKPVFAMVDTTLPGSPETRPVTVRGDKLLDAEGKQIVIPDNLTIKDGKLVELGPARIESATVTANVKGMDQPVTITLPVGGGAPTFSDPNLSAEMKDRLTRDANLVVSQSLGSSALANTEAAKSGGAMLMGGVTEGTTAFRSMNEIALRDVQAAYSANDDRLKGNMTSDSKAQEVYKQGRETASLDCVGGLTNITSWEATKVGPEGKQVPYKDLLFMGIPGGAPAAIDMVDGTLSRSMFGTGSARDDAASEIATRTGVPVATVRAGMDVVINTPQGSRSLTDLASMKPDEAIALVKRAAEMGQIPPVVANQLTTHPEIFGNVSASANNVLGTIRTNSNDILTGELGRVPVNTLSYQVDATQRVIAPPNDGSGVNLAVFDKNPALVAQLPPEVRGSMYEREPLRTTMDSATRTDNILRSGNMDETTISNVTALNRNFASFVGVSEANTLSGDLSASKYMPKDATPDERRAAEKQVEVARAQFDDYGAAAAERSRREREERSIAADYVTRQYPDGRPPDAIVNEYASPDKATFSYAESQADHQRRFVAALDAPVVTQADRDGTMLTDASGSPVRDYSNVDIPRAIAEAKAAAAEARRVGDERAALGWEYHTIGLSGLVRDDTMGANPTFDSLGGNAVPGGHFTKDAFKPGDGENPDDAAARRARAHHDVVDFVRSDVQQGFALGGDPSVGGTAAERVVESKARLDKKAAEAEDFAAANYRDITRPDYRPAPK